MSHPNVEFTTLDETASLRVPGGCGAKVARDTPDSRPFDLIGIAIGRAQAQHPMAAMRDSAESTPNRRHLPDARIEAGLNFLSFN